MVVIFKVVFAFDSDSDFDLDLDLDLALLFSDLVPKMGLLR